MLNWLNALFENLGNTKTQETEEKEKIEYREPAEAVGQRHNELNEVIRLEAYYLWERDGKPEGKADYYWQKASETVNQRSKELIQ